MSGHLLVNWVTHPLVGMTVEGLRWANAFRSRNPGMEIGLLLNRDAPLDLAACLPGLDRVFAVDVAATCTSGRLCSEPALEGPWEALFTDPRHHAESADPGYRRVDEVLRLTLAGIAANRGWTRGGLPAAKHQPVRLELPVASQERATERLAGCGAPLVSLVPGSAAEASRTPSMDFWRQLLAALCDRYPGVAIVLLGSLRQAGQKTLGITRRDIDDLAATFDCLIDAVDLPLLDQLALAARCDVHVSPHTGMSFAVQCVGTPWLVLSGAREVEYVFNGVPFKSIYPGCDRYPCGDWVGKLGKRMYPACEFLSRRGKPFACLSTPTLAARLGEILDGIDDLMHGRAPFHPALLRHREVIAGRLGLGADDNFLDGGTDVLAPGFLY